jgi:hypothetical protein
MDTLTVEVTQNDDVFVNDVSDEALEIAAGSDNGVPIGTSAACTVIWSTFCPNG